MAKIAQLTIAQIEAQIAELEATARALRDAERADVIAKARAAILTTMPYDVPQRWSRALHRHPVGADGIVYMSRHLNSERAVVLFDRAKAKLAGLTYTPLSAAKGSIRALINLPVSARFV